MHTLETSRRFPITCVYFLAAEDAVSPRNVLRLWVSRAQYKATATGDSRRPAARIIIMVMIIIFSCHPRMRAPSFFKVLSKTRLAASVTPCLGCGTLGIDLHRQRN